MLPNENVNPVETKPTEVQTANIAIIDGLKTKFPGGLREITGSKGELVHTYDYGQDVKYGVTHYFTENGFATMTVDPNLPIDRLFVPEIASNAAEAIRSKKEYGSGGYGQRIQPVTGELGSFFIANPNVVANVKGVLDAVSKARTESTKPPAQNVASALDLF